MQKLACFLLLLCTRTTLASSSSSSPPSWQWLNALLKNVTLTIPDQTLSQDGLTLQTTNGECSGLQIGGLGVDTVGENHTSFNISASGIQATCDLDYDVFLLDIELSQGKLKADVTKADLGAELALHYSHLLPASATLPYCNLNVLIDLNFSGSISASIVNLFSDVIKAALESEIHERVCGLVEPLVEKDLSQALQSIDELVAPLLHTPSPTPTPSLPDDLISWDAIPLLSNISHWIGTQAAAQIDSIARDFTNNTGILPVPLPPLSPVHIPTPIGNLTIALTNVELVGVDQLTSLSFLDPTGGPSLSASLAVNSFGARLSLTVDIATQSKHWSFPDVTLFVDLNHPSLSISDVLAVRQGVLSDLLVVQLVPPLMVPCALSALYSANISSIDFEIGELANLTVTGFNSDIDAVLVHSVTLVYGIIQPALPTLLTNIIAWPVREMANDKIASLIGPTVPGHGNRFNASCVAPPRPATPQIADLTESPVLLTLNGLMTSWIGNFSSPFSINRLVEKATYGTGVVSLPETFSVKLHDPKMGELNLTVSDLEIGGLNSFSKLSLLVPTGPEELSVDVVVGHSDETSKNPLRFSAEVAIQYEGSSDVDTNVTLAVALENVHFATDLGLVFNNQTLWDSTVGDGLWCVLGDITTARMDELLVNFTNITLNGVDGETETKLTSLANEAIVALGPLVQYVVNSKSRGLVVDGRHRCHPKGKGSGSLALIFGVAGGVGVALAVVGVVLYRWSKPQRKSELRSVLRAEEMEQEVDTVWWETTLHMHAETPWWARLMIPVILIATVALFITAHTSLGAQVAIFLRFGSTDLFQQNLFQFTLSNSVHDMWQAQVYALSLLIAICSGGWPYLKSILLAFVWFAPLKVVSQSKRETLLFWLDILGKWSLIDAYVLVLFIVAFRFHIPTPSVEGLPEGVVSADVIVDPGFGIVGFLIAAILQLTATHFIIHFHREAEGKHEKMRHVFDDIAVAVRSSKFPVGSMGLLARFGQALVVLLLIGALFAVTVGSTLDSFTFHFEGAAGVLLNLINVARDSSYSLLTLAREMAQSTSNPTDPGVLFLQANFVVFVLIIPVLYLLGLTFLWIAPLTLALQRGLFIAVEVLSAWSSLEVFCVSIIAAILEISQFAEFIVGDKCDQIDVLLKDVQAVFPGLYPPGEETKCFDVLTSLNNGCWVLFGSSLMTLLVGQLVTRATHKALNDRTDNLQNHQPLP